LAKAGAGRAQGVVALLYRTGKLVAEDDEEAPAWYRKAAEQGHVKARERNSRPRRQIERWRSSTRSSEAVDMRRRMMVWQGCLKR